MFVLFRSQGETPQMEICFFLVVFLFVFRTGPSFRSQDRARRGEADHAAIALGNRIAR